MIWILVSIFVIALDQTTKYLIVHYITMQSVVRIFPYLNFILSFNAGASFGLMKADGNWHIYLLSIISAIVSLFLIIRLYNIQRNDWGMALPISLILGGALGNLIDRVRFGFVTDFIDFHIGNWHFATFNVADSAVSVGATLLCLRLLCLAFFNARKIKLAIN